MNVFSEVYRMYLYFALIFVVILYLFAVVKIRTSNSNLPEIYEFLLLIPLCIIILVWCAVAKRDLEMLVNGGLILVMLVKLACRSNSNSSMFSDVQFIAVIGLSVILWRIVTTVRQFNAGVSSPVDMVMLLYIIVWIWTLWKQYNMIKDSFSAVSESWKKTKIAIFAVVSFIILTFVSIYATENDPDDEYHRWRKSSIILALQNAAFCIITAYVYIKLQMQKSNHTSIVNARVLLVSSLLSVISHGIVNYLPSQPRP